MSQTEPRTEFLDWGDLWPLMDETEGIINELGPPQVNIAPLLQQAGFKTDNLLHLYGLFEAIHVISECFWEFVQMRQSCIGNNQAENFGASKVYGSHTGDLLVGIYQLLPPEVTLRLTVPHWVLVTEADICDFNYGLAQGQIQTARAVCPQADSAIHGQKGARCIIDRHGWDDNRFGCYLQAWAIIYILSALLDQLEFDRFEHDQTRPGMKVVELFCYQLLLQIADEFDPELRRAEGWE